MPSPSEGFYTEQKSNLKEAEEIKNFGRPLSPLLADYLESNFPTIKKIEDLHLLLEGNDKMSPFGYAFITNNIAVVRELFHHFGVAIFCDKEDMSVFTRLAFGRRELTLSTWQKDSEISASLQAYIFNEIVKTKEHATRPLIHMLNRLEGVKALFARRGNKPDQDWHYIYKNPVEEMDRQLELLKNNLRQISGKKEFINLIAGMPYIDVREFLKKTEHPDSEVLSYIGTKEDVEKMPADLAAKNIEQVMSHFFELYKAKDGGNYFIFLQKLIKIIPEKYYNLIENEIQKQDVLSSAMAAHDIDMIHFLLDFGPPLSKDKIQQLFLLGVKMGNTEFSTSILHYYGAEQISPETLLAYLKVNMDNYEWRDFSLFPKLPLQWSASLKNQLHELLKIRFLADPTHLEQWIKTFKPAPPLVSIKPPKTDFTLDDKTFGNINNDHSLGGTTLEGSVMSKSMQYYIQFFKSSIENPRTDLNEIDSDKYKLSMEKAKENMEKCLAIDQMYEDAIDKIKECGVDKNKLIENRLIDDAANALLQQLKESKGGLIPGGWTSKAAGHAMLYELRKTESGYVFIIHNSGDGIQYHAKKMTDKGLFFSTLKVYEIPSDSLESFDKNLKKLLVTLIKPKIVPMKKFEFIKYDANRLYTEIAKTAEEQGKNMSD